jgi:hypothetical protein
MMSAAVRLCWLGLTVVNVLDRRECAAAREGKRKQQLVREIRPRKGIRRKVACEVDLLHGGQKLVVLQNNIVGQQQG